MSTGHVIALVLGSFAVFILLLWFVVMPLIEHCP